MPLTRREMIKGVVFGGPSFGLLAAGGCAFAYSIDEEELQQRGLLVGGSLTARGEVLELAKRVSIALRTELLTRVQPGLKPLPERTRDWLKGDSQSAPPWIRSWVIHGARQQFAWNWEREMAEPEQSADAPWPVADLPARPGFMPAAAGPIQQVNFAAAHLEYAVATVANQRTFVNASGDTRLYHVPSGQGGQQGVREWLNGLWGDTSGWTMSIISDALEYMNWG